MFSKYWRLYPWPLQLVLFVLMMFTLFSFGSLLAQVMVPKLTGVTIADINNIGPKSSITVAKAALWLQAIMHFFMFAAPCLLFAYLTHPKPLEYLALSKPKNAWQPLWVIGIMLGYLLLSLPLEALLIKHVHLSKSLEEMNQRMEDSYKGLLQFNGLKDLVRALFILAIIVPIGEELLFRSIIMRFAARRASTVHFPIIISSILFAGMHANPYGLVFIFIAGLILASIFWATGSLWCCIIGHAVYNGTQIVFMYLQRRAAHSDADSIPLYYIPIGVALALASAYALYKASTPITTAWAQDFPAKETSNWDFDQNINKPE